MPPQQSSETESPMDATNTAPDLDRDPVAIARGILEQVGTLLLQGSSDAPRVPSRALAALARDYLELAEPSITAARGIYVTAAAADEFAVAIADDDISDVDGPYDDEGDEYARRTLTELMQSARPSAVDPRLWVKRTEELELEATVEASGRLLVVKHVRVTRHGMPAGRPHR